MNKYHYNVIFTTVPRQEELCRHLRSVLPTGRGVAFCPMMETYRRDKGKSVVLMPMFPGYVFIRSDMKARELHEVIQKNRHRINAYIGELGEMRRKASAGNLKELEESSSIENGDIPISDLTDEEAGILDILLDFDKTGGELDFGTVMQIHKQDPEAAVAAFVPREKNTSNIASDENATLAESATAGLLRMSYGYRISANKKKWKVMEGPLRALADHIVDVDTHNKKAYLDIKINGRPLKAGFELKPKANWYPEVDEHTDVLSDGTEIDLDELMYSMTRFRHKPVKSPKKKSSGRSRR